MSAEPFPWLNARARARSGAAAQAERRAAMYRGELSDRAGLYFRLGYPARRAVARLKANVAWDFELSGSSRPASVSDREIGEIVKSVYSRRPTR